MSITQQNRPMDSHSAQRRSCDEMGLCQQRMHACPGCTWHKDSLMSAISFAPGVITGGPAKRPTLRRWVAVGATVVAVVGSIGYAVGYLSKMLGAWL